MTQSAASELLPILFSKGQNEGVDPRVAQAGVLTQAVNVRWRKDGRPAKRYGMAALDLSTLTGSLRGDYVNAITTWRGAPLLVAGGYAALMANNGWPSVGGFPPSFASGQPQVAQYLPGRHNPIVRNERPTATTANASVGYASGYTLYAWDDGGSTYAQVVTTDGSIVSPLARVAANNIAPRVVGLGQYIYIVTKNGTALNVTTFDTATLTFSGITSVGTLFVAGAFFDASARGTDWLVAWQSAAALITVLTMSNANPPANTAGTTLAPTAAPGLCKVAVSGQASGDVFTAWYEPATGTVKFAVNSSNLGAVVLAPSLVELDANNADCPGVVADSSNTAQLIWGGYIAATQTSYLRECPLSFVGAGAITPRYGLRPASKPFLLSSTQGVLGFSYWAHTHNSDAAGAGTKWDDQRTFYLMSNGNARLTREMHTPGLVGSVAATTNHLSDVVDTGGEIVTAFTNTLRFGNAAAESYGVDSVSFYARTYSQRYAARDFAPAGRATQFAGGALTEFNGYCEETGFSNTPVIFSITGSGGGALTGASNYLYVAVYEWLDLAGRRHRSAPSNPVLFASGANSRATLLVAPLIAAQSRLGVPSLHVYRSLPGQATYHRVTPNTGAPLASPGTATISYVDSMSDANAAVNEFVYTDGGVLPNELPPPSTFMCVNDARVWLGGQLERCQITASKLLVEGEPTQFSDSAEFTVFLPDECTGLASLDGVVVAFTREAIYLVTGDGPNDQGVGSFAPPRKLPSDQGCIDWRSIVETSIGVFFMGKRGIHLLPRGFGAPAFIGQDIQQTLSLFPIVKSATLVTSQRQRQPELASVALGETTVRFVLCTDEAAGGTVVAVYDMRTGGWAIDTSPDAPALGPGGTWADTFVVAKDSGFTFPAFTLWQESPQSYDDNGLFIPGALSTGDVRPFGLMGFGMFRSVGVIGEFRAPCTVTVSVSVDGGGADAPAFPITASDAADGVIYLEVTPSILQGSSISISVSDDATGGVATEGFICHGVMLEHEIIGKNKRLAAGRKG